MVLNSGRKTMLVNLCGRPHFVRNPVSTATPLFYPEDLRKISKVSLKIFFKEEAVLESLNEILIE